MVRIAVDAMGGDYAPREVVHGAVLAAREFGVNVQLVGPPEVIQTELKRHNAESLKNVEIVPASEVVGMDEKPARAVVKKKDSSIVVATRQIAEGKADGVVAPGSTGAAVAAAQLYLGTIANVDRSAIACMMPTINAKQPCIMLDCGANPDCTPHMLYQFAHMGSILCSSMLKIKEPRVGVLNIGSEETKGNELVQAAYKLLKESDSLNFVGFVEGRDFPMSKVDVVVTDGFTGNVALKTAEGIAKMISVGLKQEILSSLRTKVGGKIIEPALNSLRARIDYQEFGGALLVGVKGVYLIAHGGSKHTAIKNAVRTARDMANANVLQQIESRLAPVATGSTQ